MFVKFFTTSPKLQAAFRIFPGQPQRWKVGGQTRPDRLPGEYQGVMVDFVPISRLEGKFFAIKRAASMAAVLERAEVRLRVLIN